VRLVRVLCSECGELKQIAASNFMRMAERKCQKARVARAKHEEARRQAEREQQAILVERRKRERIAAHRVPLATQQEILRLASITQPLAPGFITRSWHVADLAKKFRIPEHAVMEILHGTYGRDRRSPGA